MVGIHSEAMDKSIKTLVVLPAMHAESAGKRLPVVYLLHGWSGSAGSWTKDFPDLGKWADQYSFIFVAPDGGSNSWYFDSPLDAKCRYETFVSIEVVRHIDSNYPTISNRLGRAITGLSMGGHGALYLAFKHQDVFGAASSMSGGVDIRPFPRNWDIADKLGDYATHQLNWETNTVINLLPLIEPRALAIQIDCGTGDFFLPVNRRLHEELSYRNIPHDYVERPGGHDFQYWRKALPHTLLFFDQFFRNAASLAP